MVLPATEECHVGFSGVVGFWNVVVAVEVGL